MGEKIFLSLEEQIKKLESRKLSFRNDEERKEAIYA
ncbi:CAAX protease, partial [Enterococcus mundtii]